jgi:hypothetical protein
MKVFEFNDLYSRQNYRPYHGGTWEPLRMEMFRMLPFQYEKSGSDLFKIYQVQSSETEITSYFDGANLITGWTKSGTGAFVGSATDYSFTSFTPNASDYIYSNDFDLTEDDNVHFSISGTFPNGSLNYQLYSGSDYVTGTTGKQLDYTFSVESSGTYHFRIKDTGTADGDITSGVPKLATSTLDVHGNYVTYNGGELYAPLARGLSYFKISDGNGIFSDDVDVDSVNFLLSGWPTFISFADGVLETTSPATFTTDGKDVTYYDPPPTDSVPFYQSPMTNLIHVKKGDILYMSFKDTIGDSMWDFDYTTPVIYFKYTTGTTITGEGVSKAKPDNTRSGDLITCKVTATADGYGRIYGTLTSGSQVRNFMNCDVYKTYSDKCIKISISSLVDLSDVYYKGGFTQLLYKIANVRRSPSSKVEIIGDERNGVLVKEKITSAVRYSVKIKVTESEYQGLVYSLGCTWTITDQTGTVFTCNNIEIKDPEWYNGNGLCEITFDDNVSVYSLNNSDL